MAFVFDSNILNQLEDRDDQRVNFIHSSLQEVESQLQSLGTRLVVRHGDPVTEVPTLAKALNCELVVAGADYEPYARRRDKQVSDAVRLELVKDIVVLEPGEVLSKNESSLRVYTPYSKAWKAKLQLSDVAPRIPREFRWLSAATLLPHCTDWGLEKIGFEKREPWLTPGEVAGGARLTAFADRIDKYGELRDVPSAEATSTLSVDLRFGTISVRQAARLALSNSTPGAEKWLNELIWREFYQDILWHKPKVVETTFQPQYANLAYPGNPDHLKLWKAGLTGYPIVDAAMRCLLATGWMHNRLRMVVASFLTKDLLLDYRLGEKHFARYLLDFELASNNGGWQWASSVGCDPQPYFRIFNPILQSRKFDPEGKFIRRWLPEISNLSSESIHAPWEAGPLELMEAGVRLGKTYPEPIVDHRTQRDLAVKLLESAAKVT